MKTYRTRYSLPLVIIISICGVAALWPLVEAIMEGKASRVFTALGIFLFYAVIAVGALWNWYVIDTDNRQLVICSFFGLSKTRIDIMKITSVARSYSILSAPASSLKRLSIKHEGGRFNNESLISPYMQDDFIRELQKINPAIEYKK